MAIHKAGYVNIIGNPNVGKSTLMNALLGEQLSITTPKAQTTRHRILGIYNEEELQIVFSDTPGVIKPAYALQESMMDFVRTTFEDADVFLYMIEPGEKELKDPDLFQKLKQSSVPLLVLVNKIDKTTQEELEQVVDYWAQQFPEAQVLPISALNNFNIDTLLDTLKSLLPASPPFFDKENLSDRDERFFVSEMVREQILLHYKKEIPYSVEVRVEAFKEDEKIIRIQSVIYVERDSQKGIIIGHQGKKIKQVGIGARRRMEAFFKKQIHLELFVKVDKEWRSKEDQLKKFGYK
jgi:GTP-binding protein Era